VGEWRCSSTILDLGTRWRWVVSLTPRPLYPRYPLDRRLGGPQSRSGRSGEEKNLLPLPEIEPRLSSPVPVAVLTYCTRNTCVNFCLQPLLIICICPINSGICAEDHVGLHVKSSCKPVQWFSTCSMRTDGLTALSMVDTWNIILLSNPWFLAYFPYLEKIKVGLWDLHALCVCVSPPSH
jgi:hypothetical protein